MIKNTLAVVLLSALLTPLNLLAKNTPVSPTQIAKSNNTAKNTEGVLLDYIVAVVNDQIILNSELTSRTKSVLQRLLDNNANLDPNALPDTQQIQQQILERMIIETIQLGMGKEMGVRISDNDLNDTLKNIAKDQKLSLADFRTQLIASGESYTTFREQIRTEMILNLVQRKFVGARIQITEQDIKNFLASAQGKQLLSADYRLSHILIATPLDPKPDDIQQANNKAKEIVALLKDNPEHFHKLAVTFSAGRNALKGGDLGWRPGGQLPSLFAEHAENMVIGDVVGPIKSSSGFHIIRLNNKRGGALKIVDQTKAQHILIKSNALRNETASRKLIDTIYKRLVSGGDFDMLAKTYSDDISNARKGGDLGWVSPGKMVPSFETEMSNTPVNSFSAPFLTEFGWHIVKVNDRRNQDLSNENRDQQARNFIYRRKFDEELQLWLQEIRQEAYVDIRQNISG